MNNLRENCECKNQNDGNCSLINESCTSIGDDICPVILHKLGEMSLAEKLIFLAKDKFPISVPYKGRLTEEDMSEIEKVCDVRCSSIYMDGTGYYSIRYRKEQNW